jgi:pilus assembly protein Flp/PilA
MKKFNKLDERGATAIEYGLIAALLVIAVIPAFQALGGNTNSMYTVITTKITNAMSTAR